MLRKCKGSDIPTLLDVKDPAQIRLDGDICALIDERLELLGLLGLLLVLLLFCGHALALHLLLEMCLLRAVLGLTQFLVLVLQLV